ncbi:hypothetical protein QFZ99_006053 [Paraburkholderia atlantica]|uniref:hypothetical protein n=1 Tax=Paraburkholderia atlantica TaxID=2654982 RepID=UPI003D24013A
MKKTEPGSVMPRIRTIKPEFWTSPQVAAVLYPARLLFIGTWNFADDYGNLPRDPAKLKMQVFPGDVIEVEPLIGSLLDVGLLTEYSDKNGERYLHIPTFRLHQVINRPSKRLYPAPDETLPDQTDKRKSAAHDSLTEHSQLERNRERNREERKGKELKPKTSGSREVSGTSARARKLDAPRSLSPTGPASITLVMRKAGITGATPSHPRIVALAEAGVTSEVVDSACDEAHRQHPDERISAAYVCTILERWQQNGHASAQTFDERAKDRKRVSDALTGRGRKTRDMGEVIDVPAKEISHVAKHS